MARSKYITTDVEVELSEFDTDELIEELEARGSGAFDSCDGRQVLNTIYEKRRVGKDYQQELEHLIWLGLGKFI